MLRSLQKFLSLLLFLTGALYLLYQGFLYYRSLTLLPRGMTVAGLDVSGLSQQEATERLAAAYLRPVVIFHRDERIELDPRDVGFVLDAEGMLQQAEAQKVELAPELWRGYLEFLLGWSLEPMTIGLSATHDRNALIGRLQTIAKFLDQPARPPQLLTESEVFKQGQDGFVTDVEASLPAVEAALYQPDDRQAHLLIAEQEAPPFDMSLLADSIQRLLDSFNGVGSIFIMDLQTGEEISINGDKALSALSILKIAIFVETYRALDNPPNEYQQELLYNTAVQSSNYSANLLLHIVAGEDNTYRGADILTESMRRLGLVNTFMAVPYDAVPPPHRHITYTTPANSRGDAPLEIDPSRQLTVEEIGTLLSMIYYCSKGGGALLAVYPGKITPEECQAIIDLMILNEEGNLIRFGVPAGTPVSHKHGWVGGNQADAGIVFTPGGDYVLVEYLHQPGGWLVADESFPILREIARAVYNYFNFDDPYFGDALFEQDRFDPNDPFFQQQDELEDEGGTDEEPPVTPEPAPSDVQAENGP